MDLSRAELAIAWLVILLAMGQFTAISLCAPRIRHEPRFRGFRSPLIISQLIGLALFIGIISSLSSFGDICHHLAIFSPKSSDYC